MTMVMMITMMIMMKRSKMEGCLFLSFLSNNYGSNFIYLSII